MLEIIKGLLLLVFVGVAAGILAVIGYFVFHIFLFFLPVFAIGGIVLFVLYGIYSAIFKK